MLVLTVTGLIAGELVTERRRASPSCGCIASRLRV